MSAKVNNKNIFRKLFKFIGFLFLLIFILIIGAFIAIRTPYVKNKIAQKGIGLVNEQFKTNIKAENVEIDWKNNLILHHVTATDQKDYPFIQIEKLKGDINIVEWLKYLYNTDWSFEALNLDKITLYQPHIEIITYKDFKESNFTWFFSKFSNDKPPAENPFIFQSDATCIDGFLSIRNDNKDSSEILSASHFNFILDNFIAKGSDISATLENLSTELKRNDKILTIKNLNTELHYSPTGSEIKNLQLETNESFIDSDIDLNYKNTDDFKNFSNLVEWNIQVKNDSHINGNLLHFITDNWDNDSDYHIQAQAKGTLNNLQIGSLNANSQNTKLYSDSLFLRNISSPNDFSIEGEKLHIITSEEGLVKVLPSTISKNIRNTFKEFGNIDYKGNFFLNSDDLSAKGVLISTLGWIDVEASLKHYQSENAWYEGNIRTKNVSILPLVKNPKISNINGEFYIKGSGFKEKNAQLNARGSLRSVTYNEMGFSGIDFDIQYHNYQAQGKVISKDSKADLEVIGEVDLRERKTKARVEGVVNHLLLSSFSNIKDSTSVQGKFNVHAEASNLDDLIGKLHFENIVYSSPENSMPFERIDINTYFDNEDRIVDIDAPNNLKGKLKGRFNLEDIPVMFRNGLSQLVVGMQPQKKLDHKYLFIDLDIQDDVINLFVPSLSLDSGSNVLGVYDSETNDLALNLTAPKLTYDKFIADSIEVIINTDNPSQQLVLDVESLYYDKYALKKFNSTAYLENDTLQVQNTFNIKSTQYQKVLFNFYQTMNEDELLVGIKNSTFKVNDVIWKINPNNDYSTNLIAYNKLDKTIYLNKFALQSNNAKIDAYGYYKNQENFEVFATTENVLLQNLIPQDALNDFSIEGLINGRLHIEQDGHNLKPLANISILDLKLNQYELGNLESRLSLNPQKANNYDINVRLNQNDSDYLTVNGSIINQTDQPAEINAVAEFNEFRMDILNELLSGVFDNIRGTVNGEVVIVDKVKNPTYSGSLYTKNVGLTVDYLKTDYLFKNDSEIALIGSYSSGNMNFENISFIDTKELTSGVLNGIIMNKEFKVWGLDLYFDSDDDENGLLILNTTEEDNELFYGKIFADGSFNVNGTTDEKISVYTDSKVLNKSHFTLNNATTFTLDNNSIIQFKEKPQEGKNTPVPAREKVSSGLNLNFAIDVEEGTEITVLLDQTTNSTIRVKGSAENMEFKYNLGGDIDMTGVYNVSQGVYFFNILSVQKYFQIEKGSEIQFTGNPYNAVLYIDAYNEVAVNNVSQYLDIQTAPIVDIDLGIQLTGKLNDMKLDFDVEAPRANSEIQTQLQNRFFNNQDEENTQFFSILATKRFNTENSSGVFSTQTFTSNAYDLIIGQALSFLNSIDSNFQFGATYLPEDNTTDTGGLLKTTLDWRLGDRWKITSTQGIPINPNSATNNSIWTQEVDIQLDISKKNDQSLVMEYFTRPNNFGVQNYNSGSTNQSYGVGIISRWEFDSFKEIFQKEKTAEEKNSEEEEREKEINPADSTAVIEKEIRELMKSEKLIK